VRDAAGELTGQGQLLRARDLAPLLLQPLDQTAYLGDNLVELILQAGEPGLVDVDDADRRDP
jgi:hypothetical protein